MNRYAKKCLFLVMRNPVHLHLREKRSVINRKVMVNAVGIYQMLTSYLVIQSGYFRENVRNDWLAPD